MRILAWPAYANRHENPYNALLYEALQERGHAITEFSPQELWRGEHDIWHLHWPDGFLVRSSALAGLLALARLTLALLLARARGIRTVWTIHNLAPHRRVSGWLLRLAHRVLGWGCDGFILLSQASLAAAPRALAKAIRDKPHACIVHGHYVSAYGDLLQSAEARARMDLPPGKIVFGFVGRLAGYKGIEELITRFRQTACTDQLLCIAGQPESGAYADRLRGLVANDSRILLRCGHVPPDALRAYLCSFDYLVLPFSRITNSGSAVLGMSYGVPVVVPSIPLFAEWARVLGPGSCVMFEKLEFERWTNPLADEERNALSARACVTLSWEKIAIATEALYQHTQK